MLAQKARDSGTLRMTINLISKHWYVRKLLDLGFQMLKVLVLMSCINLLHQDNIFRHTSTVIIRVLVNPRCLSPFAFRYNKKDWALRKVTMKCSYDLLARYMQIGFIL